jgi:hypothetical protein
MEKFLEAAALAWNPIGEVRRRMSSGTLTVSSALIPFIGIVIACNLFALGAQNFFLESLLYKTGGKLPDHPLLTSGYAHRLLSALGVLVPVGAVSDRYHIVAPEDLKAAAARMAARDSHKVSHSQRGGRRMVSRKSV